ncbi:MAG TPA: Rieske (2Fe-2S) protein [Thermoanaerobaculia bacterium]|nr:Rieske (2Fe-2S) protein [Thermoanaerobaculia bacterium]
MSPPQVVPAWYMAAPSRALRRGRVIRFQLGDHPLVLFRGRGDGVVHALAAHCRHQGVDLAHGAVVGDCLRCPLHHWEYRDGCERIPGASSVPAAFRRVRYRTVERYGMIFVHAGDEPSMPLPCFTVAEERLAFLEGREVQLDCPWYVPLANAFDMTHLRTVHHRALLTEPEVTTPHPLTFAVRYATSVIGTSWHDRAMRLLSGNRIEVMITCTASMLMVESAAGRLRSYLMVSLRPARGGGVSLLPLYAVPRRRNGLHHLHVRAARALFNAFLRRDVSPLSGIRFPEPYSDPHDTTIDAAWRHLCRLPAYQSEE